MALIGFEGFDSSNVVQHYVEKWTGRASSGSIQTASSRWGVGGYLQETNNGNHLVMHFPGVTTIIVGFAFWVNTANNHPACRFYGDNGGTHHCQLNINTTTGIVQHCLGSTAIATSTIPYDKTPLVGTWNYVEWKVTLADGTGGAATVRINGETMLDVSGIDTRNGGTDGLINEIRFEGNNGHTRRWDDVYILSGDAIAPNDFLGDCRIMTLMPDGNGSSSDLVGSDGDSIDNYQLVNQNPPNDASWVGSGTPGDLDLYTVEDLPDSIVTVHGVQVSARAMKTDTGAISGRSLLKSGGTTVASDDMILGSTFAHGGRMALALEPDGSAPWSPADVNAIEAGFEVRA